MSTPQGPAATGAFDLTDPALLDDPHGGFARMRERAPMVRGTIPGAAAPVWLVTRYDDVKTVLGDTRFVNDPAHVPGRGAENIREQVIRARGIPPEYARYVLDGILDADGEDHIRLRRLVSRAFTARRVAELRPRVAEIAEDLLDRLPGAAEDGVADLMEHFAYPLPITVICELVGIPEEDRPRWREWGAALFAPDPAGFGAVLRDMVGHIEELIVRRRAAPGDDLLTGLVHVHDEDGDRLGDAELVTMVLTLVLAGHETTAHLIGNGTAALLAHPGQLALLRREPELMPRAVHELMRWCGPVHLTRTRYAAEDVEIGGMTVRRGEAVVAVLAGANRDPRVFDDPDRLDITREPDGRREDHVGFGHGLHYCLGAALARQEGEVALAALLRRFPHLALAVPPGDLPRQPLPGMWRLARLPLRL
ncbi:cytochrome P450 [Planomonospora parontospora subsp. parontospora]|uniref:Cytochrome P450 n=2 Tax=Planomonospora parontospora TaxID=58119 RepID=A0AA37BM75_9ACTN|nr:cytochrome P450 [Planomonospora parontospora]GGK89755.1 cytochrome P450 [Planomonospora parontospora]GII11723.1 cytochrome P450 [Planomonospora parontospora subsp. parontospora]